MAEIDTVSLKHRDRVVTLDKNSGKRLGVVDKETGEVSEVNELIYALCDAIVEGIETIRRMYAAYITFRLPVRV